METGAILLYSALFLFNLGLTKKKKTANKDTELISLQDETEISDIKYIDEIEKLRRLGETPETKLDILDTLVQDFFRRKFHIKRNLEYSEIREIFLEKNRPDIAELSKRMIEVLYSGEKITNDRLNDLMTDFEEILYKEGISYEQYDAKKKEPILAKIGLFERYSKEKKDEEYVGKETKKAIMSKLLEKRKEKLEREPVKIPLRHEEIIKHPEFSEAALSFLQNSSSEGDEEQEMEEDKYIENIDDLDRIKSKIKQRKQGSLEG